MGELSLSSGRIVRIHMVGMHMGELSLSSGRIGRMYMGGMHMGGIHMGELSLGSRRTHGRQQQQQRAGGVGAHQTSEPLPPSAPATVKPAEWQIAAAAAQVKFALPPTLVNPHWLELASLKQPARRSPPHSTGAAETARLR